MISGQAFLVNHLAQVYELLVIIIHMPHYASMLRYGLQNPSQCGGTPFIYFLPCAALGLGLTSSSYDGTQTIFNGILPATMRSPPHIP